MSTGRRAYDLLRGYVGREYDRLQGLERISAEDELSQSMSDPSLRAGSKGPSFPESKPSTKPIDPKAHAARILGVPAGASFEEVRKSFERLNKRSDPSNFPSGSQEREQAGEIQRRVQWAYQTLTDGVDATVKRFRSLEID
jgi:hypothetical protein